MSQPNGPPQLPEGPSPVAVPVRGTSGSLAAVLGVCVLVIVVGAALVGRGDERPSPSTVALRSTATPTHDRTPEPTLVPTPTPEEGASSSQPEPGRLLPDFDRAIPGDDGNGPLPLGSIDEVPNADRLDFLFEFCTPGCFRDAHWMHPKDPKLGSGIWTAGRPFHVREGFINGRKEPLGEGFDLVLYVQHTDAVDAPIYRYTADFVLRGKSDRCGPTYKTQQAPATCEWFVHDFPEGLPEGRNSIWAVWEAPCSAWVDLGLADLCEDPERVVSMFSSTVDAPYGRSAPSYTERSS